MTTYKIIKFIPAILFAAFIFYMSSKPWPSSVEIPYIDKAVHLIVYSILAILISFALKNKWLLAALITGIYGLTDEWHQYYVPGRSVEIADMITNFVGAFLGAWIYMSLRTKRSNH